MAVQHEEVLIDMERLTYTVTEVAQLLGVSRSTAYQLVADGVIPVVPLPGRRKLVARTAVTRLLDLDPAQSSQPTNGTERHDQPPPPSTADPPHPRPPAQSPPAQPGSQPHTVAPGVRGTQSGRSGDDGTAG